MLLTNQKEIKNTKSIVQVKCDYCGAVNSVVYKNFLSGRKNSEKDACYNCRSLKIHETDLLKRQKTHYLRLQEKCKENDYILVTPIGEIKNNSTYIKYICLKHGEHEMKIANFLSGRKCPDCARDSRSKKNKMQMNDVIQQVETCGGRLLNPQDYINNSKRNLVITCPNCNKEFKTSLVLFTQHGGQLCPDCSNKESVGENKIKKYLESRDVYFKYQYWFPDCRDVRPLPFDFYIPDKNIIIEFDGRQHFIETDYFSYSLEETNKHDKIKNDFCVNKGINLIRIPYTDINNIKEILDNIFT